MSVTFCGVKDDLIREEEIEKSREEEIEKSPRKMSSSSKKKTSKKKKNKNKSKKKQNEEEKSDVELTDESGMDETSEVPPIDESVVAETAEAPPIEPMDGMIMDRWVADRFMDFLENFHEEDATEPFFVREAENSKFVPRVRRRYLMQISYQDIEKHNKELAVTISSDCNRFKNLLTNTLVDFGVKHACGSRELAAKKTCLVIYGVPTADSTTQSFLDFVMGKKMVEPYELYDGRRVNSTSYIGRRVGRGYVNFILWKHQQGLSWNGKFNISDMVVKDGQFTIAKPAMELASREHMEKDLERFLQLILEHYRSKDIEGCPAYFDRFRIDILCNSLTLNPVHEN